MDTLKKYIVRILPNTTLNEVENFLINKQCVVKVLHNMGMLIVDTNLSEAELLAVPGIKSCKEDRIVAQPD